MRGQVERNSIDTSGEQERVISSNSDAVITNTNFKILLKKLTTRV
jgi:hypothetical protein